MQLDRVPVAEALTVRRRQSIELPSENFDTLSWEIDPQLTTHLTVSHTYSRRTHYSYKLAEIDQYFDQI